jgi:hypothetical protein
MKDYQVIAKYRSKVNSLSVITSKEELMVKEHLMIKKDQYILDILKITNQFMDLLELKDLGLDSINLLIMLLSSLIS